MEKENSMIRNLDIFNLWRDLKPDVDGVYDAIIKKYSSLKLNSQEKNDLKMQIQSRCKFIAQIWKESKSRFKQFSKKNNDYLLEAFDIKNCKPPKNKVSKKSDENLNKAAAKLALDNSNNTLLLLNAASFAARHNNDINTSKDLQQLLQIQPKSTNSKTSLNSTEIIKLTVEEGLDFLVQNNFTKRQYMQIRKESKLRNCDIYPEYKRLLKYKKEARQEFEMELPDEYNELHPINNLELQYESTEDVDTKDDLKLLENVEVSTNPKDYCKNELNYDSKYFDDSIPLVEDNEDSLLTRTPKRERYEEECDTDDSYKPPSLLTPIAKRKKSS